ncbi:MAG: hypothetical protein LBU20_00690 [Candidatus Nomurabacteria bacterium]|nr:hypothetical protein [Candidatus Nomurabacteria bacterium]
MIEIVWCIAFAAVAASAFELFTENFFVDGCYNSVFTAKYAIIIAIVAAIFSAVGAGQRYLLVSTVCLIGFCLIAYCVGKWRAKKAVQVRRHEEKNEDGSPN